MGRKKRTGKQRRKLSCVSSTICEREKEKGDMDESRQEAHQFIAIHGPHQIPS